MLSQYLTPENILFIPVFLLVITVLVAAHEYGHYLFARIFGMGVEEFAIGFGRKPLWTYATKKYLIPVGSNEVVKDRMESSATDGFGLERKDRRMIPAVQVDTPNGPAVEETTNFTIRAWPIGGFVRIKGMVPEDDGSEVNVPGGFYSKAPWKRFIVLAAGPVFSVLAGIVLIFFVFATAGQPKADTKPFLGQIMEGSPAQKAGLEEGDLIVSVDGKQVNSFYDIVDSVRFGGEVSHTFVYQRKGEQRTTSVTPVLNHEKTAVMQPDMTPSKRLERQAMIGTAPHFTYSPMPLALAASEAISSPAKLIKIIRSIPASKLKDNVGGPIAILKQTRAAVKSGPVDIIATAALLSISVGFFNLLPIPPLDGGQMAIAFAEMFRRGRRLSMKVQNLAAAAGIFVVLLFIVVVFTLDIQRLGQSMGPKFSDVVQTKPDKPATPAKP